MKRAHNEIKLKYTSFPAITVAVKDGRETFNVYLMFTYSTNICHL